jgi:hypothetical protein
MRAGTRDQKTARRPRTGFRFRPPEVEVDAETDWLFLRAFGPPDAEPFVVPQELNRERILDLGSRPDNRESISMFTSLGAGKLCANSSPVWMPILAVAGVQA